MPLTQYGSRLAHDPSVNRRHQAMALRLREEGIGGLHPPPRVRQAQQNLAPRTCRVLRRQGYDRLRVQLEPALVHRLGEPHDPSTLHLLLEPGGRLRLRDMDAVASGVLGGVAGFVGSAQDVSRASACGGDRDDAYGDAQREAPLPPDVAELFDRPLELPGDLCRLGQGTVFQQDTEFIAAEARKRVPAAQATAQQAADLAEQVIPGFVAARVVHELESIQIQVAQDRKSTRLNSSHEWISYAVFCLKKKKKDVTRPTAKTNMIIMVIRN